MQDDGRELVVKEKERDASNIARWMVLALIHLCSWESGVYTDTLQAMCMLICTGA